VALDQFVQHGYHGTSMRQIAQAAGLAVGGLYNHFSGKEAIFTAVLEAHHPYRTVLPAMEAADDRPAEEQVRELAVQTWQAIRGREDQLLPLMFIELVEFRGRHLGELVGRLFPQVTQFLGRLSGQDYQLRAVPSAVLLRSFVGLIVGYTLTEAVLKNSPVARQLDLGTFEDMLDVFLHGVLADPPAGGEAPE
jgi:AcrR family transcriptional regulator